jgi:hypothetical protein
MPEKKAPVRAMDDEQADGAVGNKFSKKIL